MLKSRKNLSLALWGLCMKIYDFNGKKNICGERVHEARRKQHLTQNDLAAKLQINESKQ